MIHHVSVRRMRQQVRGTFFSVGHRTNAEFPGRLDVPLRDGSLRLLQVLDALLRTKFYLLAHHRLDLGKTPVRIKGDLTDEVQWTIRRKPALPAQPSGFKQFD